MASTFKTWVLHSLVVTVALVAVYFVSHYALRQSANDPQIQLANDWADQINTGAAPTSINMGTFIDPTHSLALFGIVYDKDGNIASSSVTAPTTMLQPDGVLPAVETAPNNELRFTWKPASGVRFATVIKKTSFADKTYYVLVARNLQEVDRRISFIGFMVFCIWVVGLGLVAAVQHSHKASGALRRVVGKRKK